MHDHVIVIVDTGIENIWACMMHIHLLLSIELIRNPLVKLLLWYVHRLCSGILECKLVRIWSQIIIAHWTLNSHHLGLHVVSVQWSLVTSLDGRLKWLGMCSPMIARTMVLTILLVRWKVVLLELKH